MRAAHYARAAAQPRGLSLGARVVAAADGDVVGPKAHDWSAFDLSGVTPTLNTGTELTVICRGTINSGTGDYRRVWSAESAGNTGVQTYVEPDGKVTVRLGTSGQGYGLTTATVHEGNGPFCTAMVYDNGYLSWYSDDGTSLENYDITWLTVGACSELRWGTLGYDASQGYTGTGHRLLVFNAALTAAEVEAAFARIS